MSDRTKQPFTALGRSRLSHQHTKCCENLLPGEVAVPVARDRNRKELTAVRRREIQPIQQLVPERYGIVGRRAMGFPSRRRQLSRCETSGAFKKRATSATDRMRDLQTALDALASEHRAMAARLADLEVSALSRWARTGDAALVVGARLPHAQ